MLIGQQRSHNQALPCLSQGGETDLKKAAYSVIMIEADAVSIGDSNQEKIEKDLYGGQILEESPGDKAMVDPAKRVFNLAEPVWIENPFAIPEVLANSHAKKGIP